MEYGHSRMCAELHCRPVSLVIHAESLDAWEGITMDLSLLPHAGHSLGSVLRTQRDAAPKPIRIHGRRKMILDRGAIKSWCIIINYT